MNIRIGLLASALMLAQTVVAEESVSPFSAQASHDQSWLMLAHEDSYAYERNHREHAPNDHDGDGVKNDKDRCPGTPHNLDVDRMGCSKLVDSDQDGVPNAHDQCPSTTFGARIDARGCELNYDLDLDGVPNSRDRCPGTPAGQPVDAHGCHQVADADRDGVPDSADRCPNTPAGTPVDGNGCPLRRDADGDGVADRLDRCPGTPVGTRVDSRGCPVRRVVQDRDRDGVPDDRDACPNSVHGAKVDARGCRVAAVARFGDAQFDLSSATLRRDARTELDRAIDAIQRLPAGQKVYVEGHTDSTGPDALNRKLSRQRAEAVADYLVRNGISRSQLLVRGFGPDRPAASNSTQEGRVKNRRVEIHLAK